jgi:hypothetical protein
VKLVLRLCNARLSTLLEPDPPDCALLYPRAQMLHNNVLDDALNIDVTHFARDMVESAEGWLTTAEGTTEYQANFPHYMQRYPNGLPPYIGGVAVIA